MWSVIIPCYRSPQYLAICLRSLFLGADRAVEVVVVLDGYPGLYQSVLEPYLDRVEVLSWESNRGLCYALNQGVWAAQHSRLLLLNEDNALPLNWDSRLNAIWDDDIILSLQQIEPQAGENIYQFWIQSFGEDAAHFQLEAFQEWERQQAQQQFLTDGRIFPVALSKRHYMAVGGFDLIYPSPHYCDFDFFLKLELQPQLRFARTLAVACYHFGGKSTTHPDGSPHEQAQAKQHFTQLGNQARRIFEQKWGITALRHAEHSLMPQVRFQRGVRYQYRHEAFKLATIVNFCSNDLRFIDACLQEALRFSAQVIVPVCDHFFNGEPEDIAVLQRLIARYPQVHVVGFAFQTDPKPQWYWPCLARGVGSHHLEDDIEWVLFLDADEIVEGERFHNWLGSQRHLHFDAMTLANYWYFRECHWRAEALEDSPVLIRRQHLQDALIMNPMERIGIFDGCPGFRQRGMLGLDGLPMVHHYSWVRSREEMLRKVRTWSHREDRNWTQLVEAEFSKPFSGRDFIHGYRFQKVEPYLAAQADIKSLDKSEEVLG